MTVTTLFDGTNDYILSNTGADMSMTALTMGAMVYIDSYAAAGGGVIISTDNGSGASARLLIGVGGTNDFWFYSFPAASSAYVDGGLGAEDAWYLLFMTKAAGSVTPRSHIFDGTTWSHADCSSGTTTQPDPTSTVSRLFLGIFDTTSSPFNGQIATCGIWAEDTNDATIETYTNYTTLAAKSNKRFFTDRSLINGGTMADSGVGNSETSRVGATVGTQHVPAWFTNFWITPAAYAQPQMRTWTARGRNRTNRSR